MAIVPAPSDTTCPGCGAGELVDFFRAHDVPVHVGTLARSPDEARDAPRGDIDLTFCKRCGLVHNRSFELERVGFRVGYEVSLVHSDTFRSFLHGVASRLVEHFELRDKSVLEIGCGSGYFLRLLCELGGNRGIGIDPTVDREGVETIAGHEVRMIRDYFSERYLDLEPDFVCCLSVFEAIPAPAGFLATVRRMIGNRPVGVYFEVFNGYRAIDEREVWSPHYEQCNYYGQRSFGDLFRRAGFEVLESAPCYEADQYLYVEARPARTAAAATSGGEDRPDGEIPPEIAAFAEHHESRKRSWNLRIEELLGDGSRTVCWGSGGKGIGFLNALDTGEAVPYVVDINPDRQGSYIPGSGQRIVAPEFLVEYRPDHVILTNRLYEDEIRRQIEQLGLSCELLHA